jgi:hypothetical protein
MDGLSAKQHHDRTKVLSWDDERPEPMAKAKPKNNSIGGWNDEEFLEERKWTRHG